MLRRCGAGLSIREAEREFNRLHAHLGVSVSSSTVHRWVQAQSGHWQARRVATRNKVPAPVPANTCWGLDWTGKMDGEGVVHGILGMIDHGTRWCLHLARLRGSSPNSEEVLGHLLLTISRHGKPACIRTDNAAVFHSRTFKSVLRALGIRHEFSQPGKPWQNGRIERLFLTLKQRLNLITPTDGQALSSLLGEFRIWYNDVRAHQHLYGLTPTEAWRGIDPFCGKPPSAIEPFSGWDGMLRGYHIRR